MVKISYRKILMIKGKRFYPYLKPPKTYKAKMNALRQILEDHHTYPPSEQVWKEILDLAAEQKPALESIQARMRKETERYKPSLPEPLLARFYHQGVYYYLDARNNLYQHDPGNALVGNLVGCLKLTTNEDNKPVIKVIVRDQTISEIPQVSVSEKEMYHRTYYLGDRKRVFRGLHPQRNLIYMIGRMNSENKIELVK